MNRFKEIMVTPIDDQLCFECNEKRRSSKMEELLYIYAMYKASGSSEDEFVLFPRQGALFSQLNLLFNLCALSYKDDTSASLFDVFSSWHCENKHKSMSWYSDGPFVPENIRCYCCFYSKEEFKVHLPNEEKVFPFDYSRVLINAIKQSDMLYPYVEMIDKAYEVYVNLGLERHFHCKEFQLPLDLFHEQLFRIGKNCHLNGTELRFTR